MIIIAILKHRNYNLYVVNIILIFCKQATTTAKLQEDDAAKIDLPILCQEDGKTVLRFSELFGVREPYWVVGQRKGRQRRGPMKGQFCGLRR